MSRIIRCALIQATCSTPTEEPLEKIRRDAIDKHVKLIDEAAAKGAKILCMQEIFTGPGTFKSPDGILHESITITYETRPLTGAPLKTVHITYIGGDAELGSLRILTLDRVRPIIERAHPGLEWVHEGDSMAGRHPLGRDTPPCKISNSTGSCWG